MSTISNIRRQIRLILTAPNTDLRSITTERVLTLLVQQHGMPQTWVYEKEKIIDDLLWEILFEVLSEKEEVEQSSMEELLSALAGAQLASKTENADTVKGTRH
ncbi:uncharacterized protein STEHIDRAFT_158742 [Stereum hirsutum FP-91666 SS1]|uniref:uncharacterized protein n=1 Tax=Stereum hirsutum (strain FP-91666) TaxID=721885 RepID=UPI0004449398|nr:uncharacterized protein STEHIDRAFT_158742 [Stereum hirsutum FP-91666 SS1]EIM85046.1 hypothetical protein STEHIDRAFT_158742 [Stereum hirsutum FP-91666 SS1]